MRNFSYLLVRCSDSIDLENQQIIFYTIFSDYRKVDGFLFPFYHESFFGKEFRSRAFTLKIMINPEVSNDYFIIPKKMIDEANTQKEKIKKQAEDNDK